MDSFDWDERKKFSPNFKYIHFNDELDLLEKALLMISLDAFIVEHFWFDEIDIFKWIHLNRLEIASYT